MSSNKREKRGAYRIPVLRIQPVPRNNWGDNLAHLLPREVWDRLRKDVYQAADWKCEICSQTFLPLNCHEDWGYDDRNHVQKLLSLQCLCTMCHDAIHWFRTEGQVIRGKIDEDGRYTPRYLTEVQNHVIRLNSWSRNRFSYYIRKLHYLRDLRNLYEYTLDYGIYSPPLLVGKYNSLVIEEERRRR